MLLSHRPAQRIVAMLLAMSCLTGCAEMVQTSINTEPGNVSVYVDGEYKGQTPAKITVGPEHSAERTLHVEFRQGDRHLSDVALKNEYDSGNAALCASLWGISTVLWIASAVLANSPTMSPVFGGAAGTSAAMIVLSLLQSYKFRDAYLFRMPAAGQPAH